MTRVSENSSKGLIEHTLNRNKKKLEDLQLQASTQKKLTRPSDAPINNVETLAIRSNLSDNQQYLRNANYSLLNLNGTEKVLEQLTEVLVKAKEIAIAQASDFYNKEARESVSKEIQQLHQEALALGNKRIGTRYFIWRAQIPRKSF